MRIERTIFPYVVYGHDPVDHALRKISGNRSGIVYCISEHGQLEGVVSDGDFRRWVVAQRDIDLSRPVAEIANREPVALHHGADPASIRGRFSAKIRSVPLLDDAGRLVAIAWPGTDGLSIAGRAIGPGEPTFVIAEIGNNHNGSLAVARRLIDEAALAGADCAKFQLRDMASVYGAPSGPRRRAEDLGAEYTIDLLERFQLTPDEMFAAFDHCRERGLLPLCTPWDPTSLGRLEEYGMAAYKIASADLTNHDLLRAAASTGKTLLVSTGMSDEDEILESVGLLQDLGAPFALLHCNSTYPTPLRDVRLRYLDRLREIGGGVVVGYSGHERGWSVPVAAVARGARIVEKHFTLDRSAEGNDHIVSLLPDEFREMVGAIRDVEQSLGARDGARAPTQGELLNRESLAKSLVATVDVPPGQAITAAMVEVRSPGRGLQPNRRGALLGRVLRRHVAAGSPFFPSDVVDEGVPKRAYAFRRPWGLPVRYHDHRELMAGTNPDLLEFHLSYRDLELDPQDFFDEPMDVDLVVHSPELFSGDHILDLCAPDAAYRERSIRELQRVVDLTRQLARYCKRAERPLVVTNVGGFTLHEPLAATERGARYARVAESLAAIDADGVEIVPQTMPPYPWHLGGQRFHNLFLDHAEIVDFATATDSRVCLDVSHSKLACTVAGVPFSEFVAAVAPHTAHLHVVDARGVDGEGLQIGDGEIDFAALARSLDELAPGVSFIPEIWQGHCNDGERFWQALDTLEGWF